MKKETRSIELATPREEDPPSENESDHVTPLHQNQIEQMGLAGSQSSDAPILRQRRLMVNSVACLPCAAGQNTVLFVLKTVHNFGWRFITMLTSAYLGVKGMLYTTLFLVMLPYFRGMGVEGARYQKYKSIAITPWTMKALIGLTSDFCSIGGYHKRPYILMASAFGALSFIVLGSATVAAPVAAVLFMLAHFEPAVVDLLCEGKYAEVMVQRPDTGSDLVTVVWGCYHVGSLVASVIVGLIADHSSTNLIFFIFLPAALQIMWPTMCGFLPEEKEEHDGFIKVQWAQLRQHWRVFALGLVMACCSIGLMLSNLFLEDEGLLAYSITVSVILCCGAFLVLPRPLAMCNLYMFLHEVLYVQIPGALEYFYLADGECLPNGPNFDYTYFYTYSSVVQAVFGFLGVMIFQATMRNWKFRTVFWCSTLLKSCASVVDLIIVERWNVDAGIPDKAMYMLGFNIVYQVTVMMAFMPAVVLTSKLCPKGLESTVYALLASFQNFGQAVSLSVGSFIIKAFDIQTAKPPCDFSGLPSAIVLCHMLLPLITIPLTFLLIPDARLTDSIDLFGQRNRSAAVQESSNLVKGKREEL